MRTLLFIMLTMMLDAIAWGAALPQGSRYDSRMQQVAYNGQNTTVINTRAGYVTTLVFADDEAVISSEVGFIKGWAVTKEANRVYIRPAPITQPVTDTDGSTVQQAFLPTSKDWKTNLFVTTSAHFYSLELNVLDEGTPANSLAFVVTWNYPDASRQASIAAMKVRQQAQREAQEKSGIAQAFNAAATPRNWRYAQRVKAGSERIIPDFAYDDGRFTYLGFSPLKKIPSPFLLVNGQEQTTLPSFTQHGNYRVMVIPSLAEKLVLRYGDAVVGIVNQGWGLARLSLGSTVSPAVNLEVKP
ncbi:P-type conjugative transfer protein VirB9 [Citrobacter sp. JGM124]|uniref:P-type conjugative transfer protein VirB9 n=1 Tax=Citrobacter sp. JGM124 TaxID=2799789 RepID=UPI001BA46F71|nr:P-type conjugative transfer protein VirB9 [Citrobacter sp. JGM124]MBS0847037.1 P-type conjugative transfer protein VirB9 [Citrobacter sp. JGM124]